jgi:hypothetical protein
MALAMAEEEKPFVSFFSLRRKVEEDTSSEPSLRSDEQLR